MTDLIVFSVGENKYALNIENVQRIIQAVELTNIPNAHEYIDGMMSYEEKVIKVVNFRSIIDMPTYNHELEILFTSLKGAHKDWVNALEVSLENGSEFTKTFNPHACGLGKWIDSFTSYDDYVTEVLNGLIEYHKRLHRTGEVAYDLREKEKETALNLFRVDIKNIYEHTMGALNTFTNELDVVANSLQKFIIYDNNGKVFAIKVDTIEDIAHTQENSFINSSDEHNINEFLELDGVLDLDNVLINVIKTVHLPS